MGLDSNQVMPPPIDACALLMDAEVAAAVDAKIEPGERHDEGTLESGDYAVAGTFSSTCLWRIARDGPRSADPNLSLGGASYVILNVMQWPAGTDQARRFLQSFRDAAKRGEIPQTPVPLSIPDESLWWGDGVAVSKADRSFGVSAHLSGGRPRERTIEETLAKKVASRL